MHWAIKCSVIAKNNEFLQKRISKNNQYIYKYRCFFVQNTDIGDVFNASISAYNEPAQIKTHIIQIL